MTAAAEQFFIVPVERLYPLFTQALPPTRAMAHTCLLVTSSTATMMEVEAANTGKRKIIC